MFSKILVANRGEIAVRIQQTLQAMNVQSVAVFSDPDRFTPHVAIANEAVHLPGTLPSETYLNVDSIIDIGVRTGCQAVHPGYGFLSENPSFAQACQKAGMVFIGPSADAMDLLGNKARAKEIAIAAGVPVVPGSLVQDSAEAERVAGSIGFPLLAKAVAGGGGWPEGR